MLRGVSRLVGQTSVWRRSFCLDRNVMHPGKVVMISGLTGTGKTQISIDLAKRIDGEVIIADSMQFYKGINVGTSKIRPEEMEGIPHHLIDALDPKEVCSAGIFAKMARPVIDDILARGKVPIVVGGTIFYLKWLLFGEQLGSPTDLPMRKEVEKEVSQDTRWEESIARLSRTDPEYAATIGKNDYQKLIRALVKVRTNNVPISNLDRHSNKTKSDFQYDFRAFFLVRDRIQAKEIVSYRTEQFFEKGFIEEIGKLMEQGLTENHHSMKAIGYSEIMRAIIESEDQLSISISKLSELIRLVQIRTNQLASKQLKFARNCQTLNLWNWLDVTCHRNQFDPTASEIHKEDLDKTLEKMLDIYNMPLLVWRDAHERMECGKPPMHIFSIDKGTRSFIPQLRIFKTKEDFTRIGREFAEARKQMKVRNARKEKEKKTSR